MQTRWTSHMPAAVLKKSHEHACIIETTQRAFLKTGVWYCPPTGIGNEAGEAVVCVANMFPATQGTRAAPGLQNGEHASQLFRQEWAGKRKCTTGQQHKSLSTALQSKIEDQGADSDSLAC